MFTLLGMVIKLLGDITYRLIDPRIDFEDRAKAWIITRTINTQIYRAAIMLVKKSPIAIESTSVAKL